MQNITAKIKNYRMRQLAILMVFLCGTIYIILQFGLALQPGFPDPYLHGTDEQVRMYFVNTPGCMMPGFNVTDRKVAQFIEQPAKLTCGKPMLRTSEVGSELILNMNAMEIQERVNSDIMDVQCYYQEIKQLDGLESLYMRNNWFRLKLDTPIPVKPRIEFLKVYCESMFTGFAYTDYLFFVRDKRTEKQRQKLAMTASTAQINANASETNDGRDEVERVSVMVLGVDSVSHLNFLRQMPKTADYIRTDLPHVEFWGYNKVGDNTFPNLMPVLTGHSLDEYKDDCINGRRYVDNCSFVWHSYKAADYQTAFGEDCSMRSLFNYDNNKFEHQPTDYYLNAIISEMETMLSGPRTTNYQLCLGERRCYEVLFDFARKLLPYSTTQDFFSFFWSTTLTHDKLNMPALMDDDLLTLLQDFMAAGLLNKTVVFLMSDHGLRWGSFRATYQGAMEERQPLLIAIFPEWMRERYSSAIENLQRNAIRLVTPFDLHATLLDLVDLRNLEDEQLVERTAALNKAPQLPRGISLFLPVPETRSCANAAIEAHWCTCYQNYVPLKTNSPNVKRAITFLLDRINTELKPFIECYQLELVKVTEAMLATPKRSILNSTSDDYSSDMMVRWVTKPGLAMFEATVRISTNAIYLTGTISRINQYGNQSECVMDAELKLFCYCKEEQ